MPPSNGLSGTVQAVSCKASHGVDKPNVERITLVAGLGVSGDAHFGATVQHRSRVAKDPTAPNLRQVHLIHQELLETLRDAGFSVGPGTLGENVTTRGVPLLELPVGSRLRLGEAATVELTGLRNPCKQLEAFEPGLLAAVLGRDAQGELVRKAGVMGIVLRGGDVVAGDAIHVETPAPPHAALRPV